MNDWAKKPEPAAKMATYQTDPPRTEPDPMLNPQWIQNTLLIIALGAAAALLFEAGKP